MTAASSVCSATLTGRSACNWQSSCLLFTIELMHHLASRPPRKTTPQWIVVLAGMTVLLSTAVSCRGDDDDGFYLDGTYHCCAKGEGRSCCGGLARQLCYEFGAYGDCTHEGEEHGAKIPCTKCCSGLKEVAPARLFDESCTRLNPIGDERVCSRCGDNVCGVGESRCNCPSDCR